MARQKTNKTAIKRVRMTNPKGNRKPKMMIVESARHHLRSKKSARSKRRKLSNKPVKSNLISEFEKVIVNMK